MWEEFWVAIALLLVIEGIMPFLSPASFRRALLGAAKLDDRVLRVFGLVAMVLGVALLYLVHG
jgi:uncharacterized protein YjeT (DUF2065 family)